MMLRASLWCLVSGDNSWLWLYTVIVTLGCTLEVWDQSDGLDNQEKEEKVSFNAGEVRNSKDLYNQDKIKITAKVAPLWIEELNDDFDDMSNDIDSYRCTCV